MSSRPSPWLWPAFFDPCCIYKTHGIIHIWGVPCLVPIVCLGCYPDYTRYTVSPKAMACPEGGFLSRLIHTHSPWNTHEVTVGPILVSVIIDVHLVLSLEIHSTSIPTYMTVAFPLNCGLQVHIAITTHKQEPFSSASTYLHFHLGQTCHVHTPNKHTGCKLHHPGVCTTFPCWPK